MWNRLVSRKHLIGGGVVKEEEKGGTGPLLDRYADREEGWDIERHTQEGGVHERSYTDERWGRQRKKDLGVFSLDLKEINGGR